MGTRRLGGAVWLALAATPCVWPPPAGGRAMAQQPASLIPTTPADTRPVVVLVLNAAYLRVFENFILAPAIPSMLRAWDVHLLCTDRVVGPLVAVHRGWRCRAVQQAGRGAAKTYTKRIPYVRELVRAGRDVLISDLDALWLRDPLQTLQGIDAGIVASRGSSPPSVSAVWGATVCMGFVFFRGSDPRVAAALDALTVPMREDQTDFNRNLLRERVRWDEGRLAYIPSAHTSYGTVMRPNRTYTGLRVAMLAHSTFRRICPKGQKLNASSGVIIAHCHNKGKQQWLKLKKLKSVGLWYLPDSSPTPAKKPAAPTRIAGALPEPDVPRGVSLSFMQDPPGRALRGARGALRRLLGRRAARRLRG